MTVSRVKCHLQPLVSYTNYGRMMFWSLILCGLKSPPKPFKTRGFFVRKHSWLMQNHGLGTHNDKKSLLRAYPKIPQIPHNLFGFSVKTFGIIWKKLLSHVRSSWSLMFYFFSLSLFIFSSPPIIINKTFTILFTCWINAYPHSINITRSHVTWENALDLIAQCCDTAMLWSFCIQKIEIRIETNYCYKPCGPSMM